MKKLKKMSLLVILLSILSAAFAVSLAVSSAQSGISLNTPSTLPSDI